jgi:hypothetical protein
MNLGQSRCQCPACGEYFNRVSTFDKHRTGDYSQRRCLTAEQMTAKGWRKNEAGFWVTSSGDWRPA